MQNSTKAEFYAFIRFLASLIVLCFLALADLFSVEAISWYVYGLIGGLNGVDLYNLIKVKKEG